ncbi:hypothetical protein LPJ78_001508 [Coemansia sp. RSA 989]|nr:hypothetical protein LPJ79_001627 [Coemansia sp. RSA 1821]KAJ1866871.1 hypothetical protein LPJ78_001508 [Coemansia sp. RSA 989]KAJ1874067.1 hypothetical protein LPJ55_001770 [Coemansia sp. RSA 990]KAJ2628651.1 hypothetical protein H4R22_003766 [Coemansia sp. RSA 1290]KAJ2648422.1 hypothetical protein IWW40_003957 [Coemansia sp. RSA 1250]KAJ2671259.1 hypothetical protein IWW42_003521 [Coemansia sp. RSA 1085]
MLAYQQQHRQTGGVATSTSAVPPASANAAKSKLRFGNTGIASWALDSNNASGHASTHRPKHYRLHAANDSRSALRRSQQGSRGARRYKPTYNAPHWQKHHGNQAQRHDNADNSHVHPLRRAPNSANTNKQWRAVPAPPSLAISTAKPTGARETSPMISSTFQEKDSPLLSGLSLAFNKHNAAIQVDTAVGKPTTPLYDVPQPRTPHPLSPADSMKTPGYVDPDSLPFELGSVITDPKTGKHYKLLSVLGEGSYAVVYLARDSHDGAKYALKCLSKLGLTSRQLSLQRTELDIHASVCPHPHIVTLFSHFETRDWLFLVMERVAGPDLYDYITQHPAFNANQEERRFVEATRMFEQMIDAVAHIHALKAYHRDLKPENFILGADGNLKLTDFGLATRESLSEDFECGSKPYMSYENRNGGLNPNDPTIYGPRDDYSPRLSDVWALGVLFLNLLFAQSPWTDPSRESCFKFCRFLREGAGFLVNQFPKLPREVADFLVTRVFSPESGRCSVLELKQWVQDLGYPFNQPKPSLTATASRPISLRHKHGAVGRRANGNGAHHNAGTSLNRKWSPPGSLLHAPKMPQPVMASTALALDSATGEPMSKPKSPTNWRAPGAAAQPVKVAKFSTPQKQPSQANNLSTSVPALVFSQIIPATQAAAARKMMPRELNTTAAKAAAAALQSSMLCLPKNGLGQGKPDNSVSSVEDADGQASRNKLAHLSEAENEDSADDRQHSFAEYSAAATKMAKQFPKQSIASSLGCSLSKSFALDSEDDMDFTEPLSFEDTRRPRPLLQDDSAAGAKSLPNGGMPSLSKRLRSPFATEMKFKKEGPSGQSRLAGSSVPPAPPVLSQQASAQGSLTAGGRVRFGEIVQNLPAVVPLARGGGRNGSAANSTDSSLTATLVSPSVEYYHPRMQPQAKPAPHSNVSSTAVDSTNDNADADDEAEASHHRLPRNAFNCKVGSRDMAVQQHQGGSKYVGMHSMPAPLKTAGAYGLILDGPGNTTFSWADDVEELPIPSKPSRMSSGSSRGTNARSSDYEDEMSDGLSWSASDQHRIDHSDGMFDMEL